MMILFKNFHKNKTFFLSLYLIVQLFFSTDVCCAKNIEETAITYHTKNEPFLFVFPPKKIVANLQNTLSIINFFEWIMIPIFIVAVMAAYLLGKKRGREMSLTKKYRAGTQTSLVLNGNEKYEKMIETEKPFMQKYEMVTVLFADIEGFSEITDSLDPEILLDELNGFFFYFDTVIDQYHIEKIKTMGDAYMCAGGIPQKNHTNPADVVMVALDVQNHLNLLSKQNPNVWSIRIGIHTGQVVAGMLGHKKLSYDIWGHTVNVASRLESSCKAGKIHISGTTYVKIKPFFDCEYRGVLPNINESYYVNGLKPEFVEKGMNGQLVPNHAFFVQMQLLRLSDLEDYVKSMMVDASSNLYFHNFKHTQDVYEHVELLAHSENMEDENILLLKTAALLHDIGYAISYDNDIHVLSEDIARESLPLFQYQPQQIDTICQLMKATHYESIPNNIMEKIMHDANLMYFGRADYISRMMCLYLEREKHGIFVEKTTWLQNQTKRLNNHKFYTRAGKELAKVPTDHPVEKH